MDGTAHRGPPQAAFHPYPCVFLKLMPSTPAMLQTPTLLMSQARQVTRDRLDAKTGREVDARAEIAVRSGHRRPSAVEAVLPDGHTPDGHTPDRAA